jgi:ATP-dependent DNA ligase
MLPATIRPMLARQAEEPFDCDDYLFEVKWDGIRCLAFIEAGRVRLQSRRLLDITAQFPELAALACLPAGTVLDGELVALRNGRPSFTLIQQRAQLQQPHRIGFLSRTMPVTYVIFDLLYWRGQPILDEPLVIRRERLQQLMAQLNPAGILVPEAVVGHGRAMFAQVAALGWEGIVAKWRNSPYLAGQRSRFWLKVKVKHPTSARSNGGLPIPTESNVDRVVSVRRPSGRS